MNNGKLLKISIGASREFLEDFEKELRSVQTLIAYYFQENGAPLESWKMADAMRLKNGNYSEFPEALFYDELLPFVLHPSVLDYFTNYGIKITN
jgi:hypothetical protein